MLRQIFVCVSKRPDCTTAAISELILVLSCAAAAVELGLGAT